MPKTDLERSHSQLNKSIPHRTRLVLISILILFPKLCLCFSDGGSSLRYPAKCYMHFSLFHPCYMYNPLHRPWFDNNIKGKIKLPISYIIFKCFFYFLIVKSMYFPQHSIFKHLQTLSQGENPSFTPTTITILFFARKKKIVVVLYKYINFDLNWLHPVACQWTEIEYSSRQRNN